jgi:hypothetical protein
LGSGVFGGFDDYAKTLKLNKDYEATGMKVTEVYFDKKLTQPAFLFRDGNLNGALAKSAAKQANAGKTDTQMEGAHGTLFVAADLAARAAASPGREFKLPVNVHYYWQSDPAKPASVDDLKAVLYRRPPDSNSKLIHISIGEKVPDFKLVPQGLDDDAICEQLSNAGKMTQHRRLLSKATQTVSTPVRTDIQAVDVVAPRPHSEPVLFSQFAELARQEGHTRLFVNADLSHVLGTTAGDNAQLSRHGKQTRLTVKERADESRPLNLAVQRRGAEQF